MEGRKTPFSLYTVEYYRIPITDECAPEEKDFDAIVAATKDCNTDTAVVFNCQLGRGRTSTGLVCGYLIAEMRKGLWLPTVAPPAPDPTKPDYSKGLVVFCFVFLFVIDLLNRRI